MSKLADRFRQKVQAVVEHKTFAQRPEKAGLLVTTELNNALEECKARVARIAKDCRAKNKKFRDVEFDLEFDRNRCLHGLSSPSYDPSDVQRVTQIFDKPQFFIDGADSNDIIQGMLGDCWFLSALATMSTAEGLVESFCVARDEEVGVYGFIFFRDHRWVTVIIDDLLYTSIPKFEELSGSEKALYHGDKEKYNKIARKGGKSLYFARSGTSGETWVPLIEKAYAKLHGDYYSLSGGFSGEAIEDLTGGVSTFIPSKDILDTEKFWKEELLKANQDRLFGCAFDSLDSSRSGDSDIKVNGLIGGHAYSVLRAVEYKGKKFVVVRNPWGESEWIGPWSDGSKEWTGEWLSALAELKHGFGDDGEFVMEYKDFLECFEQIDRTKLFDSSWVMSSQWLEIPTRTLPCAWSYGDVSFTISLEQPSCAVIVLSRVDDRYFGDISGRSVWSFDFLLFKKGDAQPLAESSSFWFGQRSVSTEVDLEAGEYVVHVRIDRQFSRPEDYFEKASKDWNERTLSRVLTERAKSHSIASNFQSSIESGNLPIPLSEFAGLDLYEKTQKDIATEKASAPAPAPQDEDSAKPIVSVTKTVITKKTVITTTTSSDGKGSTVVQDESAGDPSATAVPVIVPAVVDVDQDGDSDNESGSEPDDSGGPGPDAEVPGGSEPFRAPFPDIWASPNSVFLGLRVYTHKSSPVVINGQLRGVEPSLPVVPVVSDIPVVPAPPVVV